MTLNLEKLLLKAHELALTDDSRVSLRPSNQFLREFSLDAEKIKQYIYSLQDCGVLCSQPAEEWLQDHAGLILEQSLVVREQLEKKNLRRLPELRKNRVPRLLPICVEYFTHTDGELHEDSLVSYLQNYQEISVLTLAEVWSIPLFLRIALLKKAAEIVEHVRERREVCLFVEKLLSQLKPHQSDPGALNAALENAGQEMPLSGPLIVHLVSHLREWESDSAGVREWLKCKLENSTESLDQIQSYEYQLQASYQVQAGNVIQSLRKIERMNWRGAFEQISFVEQALSKETSGMYPLMDETSRDFLRKQVERIARRCRIPESRVAEQAVELAGREFARVSEEQERVDEGETEHVLPRRVFLAYYLVEAGGIKRLRQALAVCGDSESSPRLNNGQLQDIPLKGFKSRAVERYFFLLASLILLPLFGFAWWVGGGTALSSIEWSLLLFALLLPASEWGVTFAHWLIVCCIRPRPMLRYDFSGGLPEEAASMVVIPVIWSTPEEVRELAERLELHYLANRDPHIYFALLGDFTDANAEYLPEDLEVVAAAKEKIKELNDKYSAGGAQHFFLFQRRRLWNPSEGVWMGWERKRGKLVEFVELLRGGKSTSYDIVVGETAVFPRIRYCITLDADTRLPMESARRMIGVMHLPYNRPRLNKQRTRVIEGYGILQPRIGTRYDGDAHSRLSALWSGAPGVDPYAFAVSDPYQDGVGEGIFTGKGIFDVNVFAQVLCERIPENRVLSHDLLEGGLLRAGLLSDLELLDDQPATFRAYQKRLHRWVRGDWQLICWLLPRVCNRKGMVVPADLSAITRWQMVDNLRRSLLSPVLLVLLCLGMTVLPGVAGRWLMIILATSFLPVFRQCLNIRQIWANPKSLGIIAGQAAVLLAVLPYQSVLMLDAIVRTLYRLFISKHHLLEWVSSAEVERRHRGGRQPVLLGMKGGYALILLSALSVAVQQAPGPRWAGMVLIAYWAAAPWLVHWLNKPLETSEETLDEVEREELRKLAEQIWHFFEDHITEQDHWLPPDNVQIEPPNGTAHRTSPTNIGMYLASTLAARDFEFIDTPSLIERLERTLGTLEQMETWNGHLFNWVDTTTLHVLTPKYVSTVDSGNLICSLIAVKEGLAEWLEYEAIQHGKQIQFISKGHEVVARIEAMIEKTNFTPLFDSETKLFSLGFDVSLNRLDPVLYDLMASESRQTSFIATALGHIPVAHWRRLGRTMTKVGRRIAFLSWSGTMFEYLMPCLFMRTYRNTIWSDTLQAIVHRQMEYAAKREIPFGISESGYYAFDYQLNYQYRAFGVPSLGFQRGLERDLVVAPYATILALPFAKRSGLENLRRLEKLGARGEYGFYEAVDFTPERMPKNRSYEVVRSFMAHHQGMSFLTLANVLHAHNMTERFHRDKRVQAVELLLQERIPAHPKIIRHPAMVRLLPHTDHSQQMNVPLREYHLADGPAPSPEISILSNGDLTTMVTDSGGGFIRMGETAVTQWKEDSVRDDWGNFFYIRDVERDFLWSPAFQPCRVPSAWQRVQFGLDRVTFLRKDADVNTSLEIGVSSEWNADLRRLTLKNTGSETKILEVTTYSEIVLTSPDVDSAHPAFSKLFVQTAYAEDAGCLLAFRRPRHEDEKPLWAAHALRAAGQTLGPAEVETDRAEFIGRGFTRAKPRGIRTRLHGTVGAVTDPVFVMRQRIAIEPGEQAQLFAITCVGDSREQVISMIERFSTDSSIERAYQLAWTRNQIELRHLRLSATDAADVYRLAGRLLYRSPLGEEQQQNIVVNRKGQSGLWPYGISGDRPILLVKIANQAHLSLIAKLLTGYEFLRRMGIRFDLVVLNESAGGYQQDLQEALQRVAGDGVQYRRGLGNVFILNGRSLPEEDRTLFISTAHLVLRADGRSLKAQIRLRRELLSQNIPSATISVENLALSKPITEPDNAYPVEGESTGELLFFNGWGGFLPEQNAYQIQLKKAHPLPAPWINVIANPRMGCLVSEQGTGYTWWRNSRECKLTPWSNDPVLDPPGEMGYFRDEDSGGIWTLYPSGANFNEGYTVTHAQGFTQFLHERSGVSHKATVFVPTEDSVKIVEIRMKNHTSVPRNLSFTYYAEWVLGVRREANAAYIVTEWDEENQILLAHNTYQEHFREAIAFLGVYAEQDAEHSGEGSWTADRREFIGRGGTLEQPAALKQAKLSGTTGPNSDSCGAIQVKVSLAADAEQVVYVMLGCEASRETAVNLAGAYRKPRCCRAALEQVSRFWSGVTQQIEVSTPNSEMDLLLNGWLLYQVLSCRMWARTAFYQAGGAYGFRDQLQDSLALMHTRPDLTRAQILLHAAHQFEEGDVQHWWHEETSRGIRTQFSDDYLWLAYAVGRYIAHTEDEQILDEIVPYLHSEALRSEEHERYEPTVVSGEHGTLFEHSLRAIELALSKFGEHGLPLIGIGDWNDGMSRVGAQGRGESVWLSWFLCVVLAQFADICQQRGDLERAASYRERRQQLSSAANEHAWDGQWYRRAYTDQAQWLGSIRNAECRIDAIAQSWSVISGAAPQERARQAMQSFDRELVDRNLPLARLLTPPFDLTDPSPGYIQGYPPGIRENGGQYTHGAIWSVIAWCQLGRGDKAVELFHMLNPVTHTTTPHEVLRYVGEPYAMAADVYTAAPHEGRAGWTWYTGAAGWMYQAGIEWILGLRRKGNKLYIHPCIPDDWPGFTVRYRYGSNTLFVITVRNGNHGGNQDQQAPKPAAGDVVFGETFDFVQIDDKYGAYIELFEDDQQHEIELTIR